MSWKHKVVTVVAEAFAAIWRICITIDVILLAVFSVWAVSKTLWHVAAWMNRTVFGEMW